MKNEFPNYECSVEVEEALKKSAEARMTFYLEAMRDIVLSANAEGFRLKLSMDITDHDRIGFYLYKNFKDHVFHRKSTIGLGLLQKVRE